VCRDEEYLEEYQGLLMSLNANVNPAEAAHLMLNHADVFIQAPLHKSEDIWSLSFGISRVKCQVFQLEMAHNAFRAVASCSLSFPCIFASALPP